MTIKYFIKLRSFRCFRQSQRKTMPKIGKPNTTKIKKGIPSPKAHFLWDALQHLISSSLSKYYFPSISLQLNIWRIIEEVFEYIANKIVRTEMTKSQLRRTHLQRIHLTIKLNMMKSPISKKGKNELINTLSKNLLEPKTFNFD